MSFVIIFASSFLLLLLKLVDKTNGSVQMDDEAIYREKFSLSLAIL